MSFEGSSFSAGRHKETVPQTTPQGTMENRQTMSTESGMSRDKFLFGDTSSFGPLFQAGAMKRHRQTEAASRSRFENIFAQANEYENESSASGFCHKVFTLPVGEDQYNM